jgi:hypothetical protein
MKKLIGPIAAALFAAMLAPAQAAEVDTTSFVFPQFGSGLTVSWVFSDQGVSLSAGDTFVDDILFNPPLSQSTLFLQLAADTVGTAPSVEFTNLTLFPIGSPGDDVPLFLFGNSGDIIGFTPLPVDSGVYDLEVSGTALVNGAGYGGEVDGTLPIPEPSAPLLILAGIAGAIGLSRRTARATPAIG